MNDKEKDRKEKESLYEELSNELTRVIKSYFKKEKEIDVMLHNVFLMTASIGIDEGCTLQEVLGSMRSAEFELCSMIILPGFGHEDDDEGSFED